VTAFFLTHLAATVFFPTGWKETSYYPFIYILTGYVGIMIGAWKGKEFNPANWRVLSKTAHRGEIPKILDTSVIIDGRIADACETGFIEGPFIIPQFMLRELQHIADSSESLRRQRGRRGLDILNRLQKDTSIPFRITDIDVEGVREVDDKLVILAKQLRCPILTNDYNLNRVAELQGVLVLNINELANAVKAVYIPGETMEVQVIQEGKESGQGVGYLDDGTMVVIEDGKDYIDQLIPVVVTKVLQTAAGRMIFARINQD